MRHVCLHIAGEARKAEQTCCSGIAVSTCKRRICPFKTVWMFKPDAFYSMTNKTMFFIDTFALRGVRSAVKI
jgi:hypothetical protein